MYGIDDGDMSMYRIAKHRQLHLDTFVECMKEFLGKRAYAGIVKV